MDSEPSQLPDRKARKSVAFTEEKLVVDADGKVTTMSTPNEEKDSAQSHTPRTPPLSAALGAFTDASSAPADVTLDGAAPDDDGLDLTLKKKKKKPKKVEDGEEAAGDENAEDGGLDLTLKKKKKKKPLQDGEDEFAKKLKAMELNDNQAEEGEAEAEEPEVEEGDMDEGTGVWAHDATETIPYKMLLGRFYKLLEEKNPDHATSGTRSYKIPPPQCAREGNKKTIFINLADICKRMKRTEEHVTQYLFAELGTSGSTDGSRRLVIKGRFQQKQLENVLRKYINLQVAQHRAQQGREPPNTGAVEALIFKNAWAVSAFSLESFQFLREFVRDNDIPCDWQDCLGVYVSRQPILGLGVASAVDIKAALPDSIGQVVDTVTWGPPAMSPPPVGDDGDPMTTTGGGWDVDEIRATLAGLGLQDSDGVVLQANAATVHPYRLVAWILERLLGRHQADSFALHTHTSVTRLSQRPGGRGGWTLATPRGDISAGRVLLATNGFTSALLPELEELIIPVRWQAAAAVPASGGSLKTKQKKPVDLENRMYTFLCEDGKRQERLLQTGGAGGQLIVAGGRHLAADLGVGRWRDDVTEPRVERHLENLLDGFLSGGTRNQGDCRAEMPEVRHWTGIEGYSRDYNPWVGAVPERLGGGPGLFLSAGYTLSGLAVAPLCAKRVVQEMMTTTPAATGGERDDDAQSKGGFSLPVRPPCADPASQDKVQLPSKLASTPGRVDAAMEDWPDVQTVEEEGLETFVTMGVSQIVKGMNAVPFDLQIPSGLKRFEGKGAMGKKW
ncbi:hypothetical protein PspLS_03491 [Pyricularia sp. CBS 133598]|nr:hypothetical protein PspLS_03491 [Pyricularia sp. CBS 133598]